MRIKLLKGGGIETHWPFLLLLQGCMNQPVYYETLWTMIYSQPSSRNVSGLFQILNFVFNPLLSILQMGKQKKKVHRGLVVVWLHRIFFFLENVYTLLNSYSWGMHDWFKLLFSICYAYDFSYWKLCVPILY